MILLSHPTGNQNSRQALLSFTEALQLAAFGTALQFNSGGLFANMVPIHFRQQLERRDFSGVVHVDKTLPMAPIREGMRLVSLKMGFDSLVRRESGWASVDQVYRAVDRAVANRLAHDDSVQAVYAYEDGALETFKVAQLRGIERLYELPIGYWRAHRRLCAEEARLHPPWAHTWHADVDSDEKVLRKDEELALASRVIVPSRFVAETLKEYPGVLPPVSVIPYGCPPPIAPDARRWYAGGPLKVLFVGGLSQRKGLTYLLDAVAALGDAVSVTVIGSGAGKELIGTQHRWLGSVSHSVVLDEMRNHDIFVFPTLFEGYSLAVAEALSQGLPVITTPNSGAADIITDGGQGWIVPIRDSASIAQRLQLLIDTPESVAKMGKAALQLAASWTWGHYRSQLYSAVLGNRGVCHS